jgi:hypothetical protein
LAAHTFYGLDERFRGYLKGGAWTLCIGAGVCADVLPAWSALTRDILTQALNANINSAQFSAITNAGWGFDALMQAALNGWLARGGTPETFSSVVEHALYDQLLKAAGDERLQRQLVAAFATPHLLRKEEFRAPSSHSVCDCDGLISGYGRRQRSASSDHVQLRHDP